MLSDKAFNAKLFKEFMKRLLKASNHKDNLRVHHACCNKPWLQKNIDKIELVYLPSYSPDLNPVELHNNDLKTAFHKGEPARCKGKLKNKVRKHLRQRQREPHIVQKFFKKSSTTYAKDEDVNV